MSLPATPNTEGMKTPSMQQALQRLQRENSSESAVIMEAQHARSAPASRLTVARKVTITRARARLVPVTNLL
ncbi:hypothetical protein NLI96_g7516 [Meripilus lineatus]|uniref:Uncharacterized protein n=1 Tax=Meripilus lineatus TaxID=2056292 RepID=A0AAD5UZA6_9APHY|nr:hypothetical protein NLI96_g7516 [Physisporinus lineatus]